MNDFASEMRDNPHLRVLVFNGRCDLACPVDLIRYNIDHLKLDSAYRANITYAEFEAGHMMYLNPPDLRKMQKEPGAVHPLTAGTLSFSDPAALAAMVKPVAELSPAGLW